MTMKISRKRIKNDKEFHGITVNGTLPELYLGGETGYYIDGEKLCRVGKDFLEKADIILKLYYKEIPSLEQNACV